MELTSPPFRIMSFGTRNIGSALHKLRGLVILDPAEQTNLPVGTVRLYVAERNALYTLCEKFSAGYLDLPRSKKQARLALHAYRAFLDPSFPRPHQFEPKDPRDDDWQYWDDESSNPDWRWSEDGNLEMLPDP